MPDITLTQAREALVDAGYAISRLSRVNEGANHTIFRVILADGRDAVCKFPRTRETENGIVPPHTDTLFGGKLSLRREQSLYDIIRKKAGVPTPRIYGIHPSRYGEFLLVEALPGVSLKLYLRESGYSGALFLQSMEALGHDFAAIHRVTFPSFGNIMAGDRVDPPNLTNFADRWKAVLEMRITYGAQKNAFSPAEDRQIRSFFFKRLEDMRARLDASVTVPVLNFTDMHADNYFVDANGKPSGYFDLESAQAAPAALEFYGFRFFLFNFYDEAWFERAQKAFFKGYTENGGRFVPCTAFDNELIDFLAAGRMMELTNSYWGHIDGIRDTWGARMKSLLLLYMETGTIDYASVGSIWRQRDGQPVHPN